MNNRRAVLSLTILASLCLVAWSVLAHEGEHHSPGGNGQPGNAPMSALGPTPCVNGTAGTFPCNKVDLASFLPIADIDGTNAAGVTANDIWGWTDALTNKEYALLGLSNGVAFVDVTNPTAPVYLGNLPAHGDDPDHRLWRSLKVYRNHLYAVSEIINHGLQVFDLTQLRGVTSPQTFAETAHYNNFSSAHTINVRRGDGLPVRRRSKPDPSRTPNVDTCPGATATRGGGLHMIDVHNPAAPAFAGCVNEDGYTHETECLIYRGPDVQHQGREVCFSSNEDTLTMSRRDEQVRALATLAHGLCGRGLHASGLADGRPAQFPHQRRVGRTKPTPREEQDDCVRRVRPRRTAQARNLRGLDPFD